MIRERPGEGIHLITEPFGTGHHPFWINQLENPERSREIFRKHRDEPLLKLWGYHIKVIRGQGLKIRLWIDFPKSCPNPSSGALPV